jgi:hypothetical protein
LVAASILLSSPPTIGTPVDAERTMSLNMRPGCGLFVLGSNGRSPGGGPLFWFGPFEIPGAGVAGCCAGANGTGDCQPSGLACCGGAAWVTSFAGGKIGGALPHGLPGDSGGDCVAGGVGACAALSLMVGKIGDESHHG